MASAMDPDLNCGELVRHPTVFDWRLPNFLEWSEALRNRKKAAQSPVFSVGNTNLGLRLSFDDGGCCCIGVVNVDKLPLVVLGLCSFSFVADDGSEELRFSTVTWILNIFFQVHEGRYSVLQSLKVNL